MPLNINMPIKEQETWLPGVCQLTLHSILYTQHTHKRAQEYMCISIYCIILCRLLCYVDDAACVQNVRWNLILFPDDDKRHWKRHSGSIWKIKECSFFFICLSPRFFVFTGFGYFNAGILISFQLMNLRVYIFEIIISCAVYVCECECRMFYQKQNIKRQTKLKKKRKDAIQNEINAQKCGWIDWLNRTELIDTGSASNKNWSMQADGTHTNRIFVRTNHPRRAIKILFLFKFSK